MVNRSVISASAAVILCIVINFILSCGHASDVYQVRQHYQKGEKEKAAKFLKSPNPIARQEAVKLLVTMGECSDRLYAVTHDPNMRVRAALAKHLGNCNTKEAKKSLIALSKDNGAMVRKAVPASLIKNDYCRGECLFNLRQLLDDTDPFVKLSAAKVMDKRFPQESHSAVIDCLSSRLSLVTEEAIKSLPQFRNKDDIYYLAEFLENEDKNLRVIARKAIEDILGRTLSGTEYANLTKGQRLASHDRAASPPPRVVRPRTVKVDKKQEQTLLSHFNLKKNGLVDKNAIAVIIGNRDYSSVDIPDVDYALRDAKLMKEVARNLLGVPENNIIFVENAKTSDFNKIFGTATESRCMLANWAGPDSKILVYYSGHGAPELESKDAYFVPVDSDINYIKLSGYPLKVFYKNLESLNARSVTVILDTCFSGITHKGSITKSASPVFVSVSPQYATQKPNMAVLCSSKSDEISSWDNQNRFGLFTYHFVKSLKEGDADRDGSITIGEIKKYVSQKVPYYARKLINREQNPQVRGSSQLIFARGLK